MRRIVLTACLVLIPVILISSAKATNPKKSNVTLLSESESISIIGGGCPADTCSCASWVCDQNQDPSCPYTVGVHCTLGSAGYCEELNLQQQRYCNSPAGNLKGCKQYKSKVATYCGTYARITPPPGKTCDQVTCSLGTIIECGDYQYECELNE